MAIAAGYLLWILLAFVEARLFRLPRAVHIAGAVISAAVSWVVLGRMEAICLVGAIAAGRGAIIALAWLSRPAAEGVFLTQRLNSGIAVLAVSACCAATLLCGWRAALLIVLAGYVVIRSMREFWYQRKGGVDGAALSIVQRLMEITALLIGAFVI